LSEQDRDGRQTRSEIQITHWSKDEDLVSLYSSYGICECKILVTGLIYSGRHGYDGIVLSSVSSVVILRNTGDKESGGLLLDLLNDLVGSVNVDSAPPPSKTIAVDPPAEAKDPIAKFLETYLQVRT
jgi:methyl coenzyme M reductase alpha subunit